MVYDIYCDMDGVVVDFLKGYELLTGKKLKNIDATTPGFWEPINKAYAEGNHWFATLPATSDCHILWDAIKNGVNGGTTQFLTSSAGDYIPSIREDKTFWIRNNLKPDRPVLFSKKVDFKCEYAKFGRVLIDDSPRAIIPWVNAGGIGILHTSAEDTIKRLRALAILR